MTFNSHNTFLSFIVENEYFAINVDKVLEVLQLSKITRVPNIADEIVGVINFRGEIIPIYEIRTRLGLPKREENQRYVIIVLEILNNDNNFIIGAIVDRVNDVINITDNQIAPIPKLNANIKEEYLYGIFKKGNDFIMILNVDKFFEETEN